MKKTLALLLCLCSLCGCTNIISSSSNIATSSQTVTTIIDSSSSVVSKTESIKIKTKIYPAKKTTTYSRDLIFPETAYTSVSEKDYFYYSQLSSKHKYIYNELCENIEGMADGFIDLGKITDSEISLIITSIKSDRPEYFWLGRDYITNTKSDGTKQIAFMFNNDEYKFNYLFSAKNRNKILGQIKEKLVFLESKVINKFEFHKELTIHNYVVDTCNYDNSAIGHDDEKPHAYNVYGGLILKNAVCEGYARTIQLINNHFGINTTVIFGKSNGGNHMWNLVKLNGEYYYLDATFNDSTDKIMYSYFNLTTKMLERTHTFDAELYKKIKLPYANSLENNYFYANDSLITDDPKLKIYDTLDTAVHSGRTSIDIGYADTVEYIPKNNIELKNAGINIMDTFNLIARETNVRIYNVKVSFAANGNFKVSWTFE